MFSSGYAILFFVELVEIKFSLFEVFVEGVETFFVFVVIRLPIRVTIYLIFLLQKAILKTKFIFQ